MTPAGKSQVSGNPLWIERYGASEKTEKFYSALFGWEITEPDEEMPLARPVTHQGQLIASFEPAIQAEGNDLGFSGWLVTLGVKDVALAAKRAQEYGGTLLVPPTPIDDSSSFATIGVPCGLRIGLMTLEPDEEETQNAPGFPVWHEAFSGNFAAAVELFTHAFGWDPHHLDSSLDYVTNGPGDAARAGLSTTSQEFYQGSFPIGWEIYFGVENVDSACERVTELGGTILSPGQDTPWGRIARCTDPDGVGFSLTEI